MSSTIQLGWWVALSAGVVLASACGSDSSGGSSAGGAGSAGRSGGGAGGAARGGAAGATVELAGAQNAAAGAGGADTAEAGAGGAGGADSVNGGASGESSSAGEGGCAGVECEPHKLVFVTSTGHNGNFGGVLGADQFCQDSADAAHLNGTFKAWLSSADVSSSPSVRFTHATVPYRLIDGSLIANDWADLTDGTIAHDLDLTEVGTQYSEFVYSFTLIDGTPGLAGSINDNCYGGDCNCNGWTNDQGQGTPTPGSAVGQPYATDKSWTEYSFYNGCDTETSLYCFEQ